MGEQILVEEWQPFFVALAGASASLAGLVFVAMSLHPQAILAERLTRVRAYAAAAGFLIGVTWALIMLLPARTAPLGSVLLIVVGGGGSIFVVYLQIQVRKVGLNIARVVLGDLLMPVPIIAGCAGILLPRSEIPFVLLAVAASMGLFLLFSQSWTLVLHSIIKADEAHGTNSPSEENSKGLQMSMTRRTTTTNSGTPAASA